MKLQLHFASLKMQSTHAHRKFQKNWFFGSKFALNSLSFRIEFTPKKGHWKCAILQSHIASLKMHRTNAHRKFHQNGFAVHTRTLQLATAHRNLQSHIASHALIFMYYDFCFNCWKSEKKMFWTNQLSFKSKQNDLPLNSFFALQDPSRIPSNFLVLLYRLIFSRSKTFVWNNAKLDCLDYKFEFKKQLIWKKYLWDLT